MENNNINVVSREIQRSLHVLQKKRKKRKYIIYLTMCRTRSVSPLGSPRTQKVGDCPIFVVSFDVSSSDAIKEG